MAGRDDSRHVFHSSDPRRGLARRLAGSTYILAVANDAAPFGKTGVAVIPDRINGVGASGGLDRALVEGPTEQVMIIACDDSRVPATMKTPDDDPRVLGCAAAAAADH